MSEFSLFVKNFIKEIRKIMRSKDDITVPWKIQKDNKRMTHGNQFRTTNPYTTGMEVKVTFGSNRLNIYRTNSHIGWNDYHFMLYADPACIPETVVKFMTEIPDAFIKMWLECREGADDFTLEIRE
jgi:hypothetical protein